MLPRWLAVLSGLPLLALAQPAPLPAPEKPALRVGVAGGLGASIERFVPALARELGQPIHLVYASNLGAFKLMATPRPPYDVVIGSVTEEIQPFLTAQHMDLGTLQTIGTSRVVLWCPSPRVMMRVSPDQTLNQPSVRRLAISQKGGSVATLAEHNVTIPPQVQVLRAEHSLAAWKMARDGQADCALIMAGFLKPSDSYQPVKNASFSLSGVVSRHAEQPQQAERLLALLRTPRWQWRLQLIGFERSALEPRTTPAAPRPARP